MSSSKLTSVQALRGIAALMVCIFHLATHKDPSRPLLAEDNTVRELAMIGPVGVFIFFVISGFILPFAMNKSNYKIGQIGSFLVKRVYRLYPPYLVILLLTTGMLIWNNYYQGIAFEFKWSEFISHIFYLTHILHFDWYNPIFWTLAIEFQFYIFLGLIFPIWNSEKWIARVLSIVSLVIASWYWRDDRFLISYISPFVMGYAVYLMKLKKSKWIEALFYIAISSIVIWKYFGWHWLIASIAAVVAILFFSLNFKPFQYLGKVSYSLYLLHAMFGGLAIYLLMPYFNSTWGSYFTLVVGITFSVFVSEIFFRWVEQPAMKWADRYRK